MTNSSDKRIAFIPFTDPTNNYIARMQTLLSNFGRIEQYAKSKSDFINLMKGKKKI